MTKKELLDKLKYVSSNSIIIFRDGDNNVLDNVDIAATPSEYVEVHFFKNTGKWYTTEFVKWTGLKKYCLIHDAFDQSLRDHFAPNTSRLIDMHAICIDPLHEHSHPISSRNWFGGNYNRRKSDKGKYER